MDEQIPADGFLGHSDLTGAVPTETAQMGLLVLDNVQEVGPYTHWLLHGESPPEVPVESNADSPVYQALVEEADNLFHDDIWSELENHLHTQRLVQESMRVDADMAEAVAHELGATSIMPEKSQIPAATSEPQQAGHPVTETSQQTAVNYETWTMHSYTVPEEAESSSRGHSGSTSVGKAKVIEKNLDAASGRQSDELTAPGLDVPGKNKETHREGVRQVEAEVAIMGTGLLSMGPFLDEISEGVSSTNTEQERSQERSGRQAGNPGAGSGVVAGALGLNHGSHRQEKDRRKPNQKNSQKVGKLDARGPPESTQVVITENSETQVVSGTSDINQRSHWAEQLLNLCAAAIASNNIGRTQHLMWVLNDLGSYTGDTNERLAAHGLKALFCRISNGKEAAATYVRPLHHQEFTLGPKVVHRALVKYHEYNPWHQCSYVVTNQTLLEVFAGKSRLHILDLGVIKGIQWPCFIDALVSRPGGPPSLLRITSIRDQRKGSIHFMRTGQVESEHKEFMNRLVKFAKLLGLRLELEMILAPLECITREDLKLKEGEVVAACVQFRMHRVSTDVDTTSSISRTTESRLCSRDELLSFLFKLEPNVLIVSDNDDDHCSQDFLERFQKVTAFWFDYFDAMNVSFDGRDPEIQQIVEYEGAMMMLNQVACEGAARIERNETRDTYMQRIMRAGFLPMDISEEAKKAAQTLIQKSTGPWTVTYSDSNVVNLLFRNKPLVFSSVWKTPSCSKTLCKCNMLHN